MRIGPYKFALGWLAFAGFLVQSLSAGIPAGVALCLGCERSDGRAWSICPPCAPGTGNHCEEQCEPAMTGHAPVADSASASADERCGCIDILLPSRSAPAALRSASGSLPRWNLLQASEGGPAPAIDRPACEPQWEACARAGPALAFGRQPRLLVPLLRRTVLII